MSDIAVRVEGIGKKYQIGKQRHATIGDRFRSFWTKSDRVDESEFWALKDVSFEIKKGEAVGIIGKNGAGKSTLLKVLSKITHPTTGRFEMNGRVSSLLEVGTGFHPELTGRENIFLNGTILGMTRSEIKSKFDEIIDFSGVSKFLDTPVKHYSSGMYVRLAFSVAAHLEPEILIIDEVLAVGDAEFQKKCLGKMDEVAKEGRTVIFVSHNLLAVNKLCNKSIILDGGKVGFVGNTEMSISHYLSSGHKEGKLGVISLTSRMSESPFYIKEIKIYGKDLKEVKSGETAFFDFSYEYRASQELRFDFAFGVADQFGQLLFRNFTGDLQSSLKLNSTNGIIRCVVPRLPLSSGEYLIGFRVTANNEEYDSLSATEGYRFRVAKGDFFNSGKSSEHAKILVDHSWETIGI